MISLLNYGINYVDNLYRSSSRSGNDTKNITNTREKLEFSTITVRADGHEAKFTPTHYESYIQIYKDPKTAVAKYAQLQELRAKKKASTWTHGFFNIQGRKLKSKLGMEGDDQITYEEALELRKLERLEELALEFDKSHKYMAEKDAYSQQDIDYAFRLHDKETTGLQAHNEFNGEEDVNEGVRDSYKSASGLYITIFMEKFFKDIKDQWMKEPKDGGISEDDSKNPAAVGTWLDDYLTTRIKKKEKGFLMIVKGIYRSIQAADPTKKVTEKMVMEKLIDVLQQTVVNNQFSTAPGGNPKMAYATINLYVALSGMVQDRSKFNGIVKTMTQTCRMEEQDKTLSVKNKRPQ